MLTENQVNDAISLYKTGVSLRKLGELFNTTHETIRTDIRKTGFNDLRLRGSGATKKHVDLDLMKQLRKEKLNISEIAKEMELTRALVRSRFIQEGLDRTYLNPVSRYYDKEEIERLYCKERWSLSKIAKKLGGSAMTVRRFMLEQGIATRPVTFPRKLLVEDDVLRYRYLIDKLSTYKLANIYGVKPSTINIRLKKLGVKLRGARFKTHGTGV